MEKKKILEIVCVFLVVTNLLFLGIVTGTFGRVIYDKRMRNMHELYSYRNRVIWFLEEMSPEDRKHVSQENIFDYLQSIKWGKFTYTASLVNDVKTNKKKIFVYSTDFYNAIYIDIP